MNTNTKLSIEIMYRIKEMLNTEIRKHGEIQINNKNIWDGYLHKMDNDVWNGLLMVLQTLEEQHPKYFTMHHLKTLNEAVQLMNKYGGYYDNVLDMKNRHVDAKRTAWKCIMMIREVWNACVGEYLPNSDSSKTKTTFGDIFE